MLAELKKYLKYIANLKDLVDDSEIQVLITFF